MIFLSGDVVALMSAVFIIALIASLIITAILKLIYKERLNFYWCFLIVFAIAILMCVAQ